MLSHLEIRLLTLIQGAGAGLRATPDSQKAGRLLFLAGVIISALVYGAFLIFLVHSHLVFRNDAKFDRHNFPWLLAFVLYASSLGIIVSRSYMPRFRRILSAFTLL